jgi:hypothetical protein
MIHPYVVGFRENPKSDLGAGLKFKAVSALEQTTLQRLSCTRAADQYKSDICYD